ncbi:hypothetical protein [Geothrix limicola]|uniref:hypothetical protein n=1 Tax=Geothrix limicola TaxID=2927978 RepID=UPI002556A015|nr:hypothetical protein [Geothrix limicola]
MSHQTEAEFIRFLAQSGITLSPRNVGIGSQLSSDRHRRRIVTIHFQEDEPEENQKNVLRALFALEPNWFVFPRYGSPSDLLGIERSASSAAIVSSESVEGTVSSMIALQSSLKIIEFDPYFISCSGEILAAWDHHVFSDGFSVKFASVPLSTTFISNLNELDAEFEVFGANA